MKKRRCAATAETILTTVLQLEVQPHTLQLIHCHNLFPSTLCAPYSATPRPQLPINTHARLPELTKLLEASAFTVTYTMGPLYLAAELHQVQTQRWHTQHTVARKHTHGKFMHPH